MEAKSTSTTKRKSPAEILREKKINAYWEKITQDEELVNLLTGEKTALVGENIIGLAVSHKQFGSGQVSGQDALTISVQFASGTRRFPIPNAFLDGFLDTEDEALNSRMVRYREICRQITETKRGIADADRAIQLLKKVSAKEFLL